MKINGLKKESVQGDRVVAEIFEKLGVKTTFSNDGVLISKVPFSTDYFEYDFINCPDLAQTVALYLCRIGNKSQIKRLAKRFELKKPTG